MSIIVPLNLMVMTFLASKLHYQMLFALPVQSVSRCMTITSIRKLYLTNLILLKVFWSQHPLRRKHWTCHRYLWWRRLQSSRRIQITRIQIQYSSQTIQITWINVLFVSRKCSCFTTCSQAYYQFALWAHHFRRSITSNTSIKIFESDAHHLSDILIVNLPGMVNSLGSRRD